MFSKSYASLIDALLPTDCPAVERPLMVGAAQDLLRKRIEALALPMRLAICVIASLFTASAFLMLGHSFEKGSIDVRRQFIARAENVPLIPFRELIRLVRSFTLMSFYDHPLTRNRIEFQPGGSLKVSS